MKEVKLKLSKIDELIIDLEGHQTSFVSDNEVKEDELSTKVFKSFKEQNKKGLKKVLTYFSTYIFIWLILIIFKDQINDILYNIGREINTIIIYIFMGIVGFIMLIMILVYTVITPSSLKSGLKKIKDYNLKTPEETVAKYLFSINYELYHNAYDLLSNKAQIQTKIEFEDREMNKRGYLKQTEFNDLQSYEKYLQYFKSHFTKGILGFGGKKFTTKLIYENSAIVTSNLIFTVGQSTWAPAICFALVKDDGKWIICNGFIWPELKIELT